MPLPTEHPQIRVTADERSVEALFEDRRWEFPREDCVLLPIANTTAELLAWHLGRRLQTALEQATGRRPERMILWVDENEGQWARCELTADPVPEASP